MLKLLKPVLISLVVLAVVIGVTAGLSYAQSQSKCYFEPGGVGITAASGCTITLESGAALDVDSGATVTGLSTSTLTSLTVSGATALNGGITADTNAFSVADTTGNTVVSGTLTVSDTLNIVSGSDFNGAMNVDANVDADSFSTAGNSDLTTINNSAGDITINDNADITGTLQYGADNLYPLGYASANQQIVCGRTDTFTASTTVSATGLTTVTYVLPVQVTAPITTAAYLYHSVPTTSTFTLTSLENDFDAGSTGIMAEWCAVGDQ